MTSPGTVYLIGAGPGDRDLITMRGVKCLRRADVVLYDYLVNPDILTFASEHSERICLGRHGGPRWSQQDICRRMVTAALAGQTVARLKGGDPMIFGRATEELSALADAGVPFEIVPGVTTAVAAASYVGLPITARDAASAVAFVTGQERPEKATTDQMDFASLAKFPGTLVFYMGVTTAVTWTQRLLDAGMSPDCPVALVRRCSWPDQRVIRCRLEEVVSQLSPRHQFPPPVIAIVGEAAGIGDHWNWFARRPLHGHTVLVTRPRGQADEVGEALREWGADVINQPALVIHPPPNWSDVDDCLSRWKDYRWIVFSSSNGVHGLMDRIKQQHLDIRSLAGPQLIAVGPGTAKALHEYLLMDVISPAVDYRAESVVEMLREQVAGHRVLVVRGSRSRDVLSSGLRACAATVREVVVYQNEDHPELAPDVEDRLASLSDLWVLATSPASAQSIHRLLTQRTADATREMPIKVHWVSISPLTSSALLALGLPPAAQANEATMESLLEALRQAIEGSPSRN